MKRYAIIAGARDRREAEAYLPDNYQVIHEFKGGYLRNLDGSVRRVEGDNVAFVIAGEDRAGWTLDSYIIPRYASGLIGCDEIDLSHPVMKEVPA